MNEGYEISDVLVDGESIGIVKEHEFIDVRENHLITAEFEVLSNEDDNLEDDNLEDDNLEDDNLEDDNLEDDNLEGTNLKIFGLETGIS